ncbi:ComEA family DNA-binding protein [Labedella populi]|uniref:ComEA family DNA-binding protein n=1 Tax=Labedella populi TaxID=2498850 RepID=A0A444QBZ9_9MICO|nr:ComEA family DNA-binding protein [Labedella populi]
MGAAAAVVLVLALLGIAATGAAIRSAGGIGVASVPLEDGTPGPGTADPLGVDEIDSGSETRAGAEIYVHVLGAVVAPGLYTLASDARVVDAIAAAGGFSENADPGTVNLARTVTDGEQIVVGEPGKAPTVADGSGGASGTAAAGGPGSGPVSLNTATAEQLESLPRIGPALAERIIAWRTENGPFRLVDELLDVPGIGDAILAGLDGLVTT